MTFTFNGNYRDHDQVAHLWDAYVERFLDLKVDGRYPYNDSFIGEIGGTFATPKDQDSAIYLLQSERHEREDAAKVFTAVHEGCVPLDIEIGSKPVKFARIVHYEFQNGRTGFQEWKGARLVNFGHTLALLPKGKRTNGHLLSGKILVSQKGTP